MIPELRSIFTHLPGGGWVGAPIMKETDVLFVWQ